jgi:hypothetical protein
MAESKIIPMVRNYMGDHVTAPWHDADWYRVEIKGIWLGDFPSPQDATHAFARAHVGLFPSGMLPEYAATITAALRG